MDHPAPGQRRSPQRLPIWRPILRAIIVVSLGLGSTGCAAVKPWQRGRMAKRCMQLDPSPESTLVEQHVYQYREGSAGGYGGLGGGCGCN